MKHLLVFIANSYEALLVFIANSYETLLVFTANSFEALLVFIANTYEALLFYSKPLLNSSRCYNGTNAQLAWLRSHHNNAP